MRIIAEKSDNNGLHHLFLLKNPLKDNKIKNMQSFPIEDLIQKIALKLFLKEILMKIHYLEIVTHDIDSICKTYSQIHAVTFSEGDPNLGGARTATLSNGGLLGVRAPLRDTEEPIVRPYILVEDIEASVSAAADSGAWIALPPMEIKGHGMCAIIIQGGVETGLWQL
jgi:predicted enzyme related to lactoylglutathione lyase